MVYCDIYMHETVSRWVTRLFFVKNMIFDILNGCTKPKFTYILDLMSLGCTYSDIISGDTYIKTMKHLIRSTWQYPTKNVVKIE